MKIIKWQQKKFLMKLIGLGGRKIEMCNEQQIVCNKCGSTNVEVERKLDGNRICQDCGYIEKNYNSLNSKVSNKPTLYVSKNLYEDYKKLYGNAYEIICVSKLEKITDIDLITKQKVKEIVDTCNEFLDFSNINLPKLERQRCSHCKPNIICGNAACPFLPKITC